MIIIIIENTDPPVAIQALAQVTKFAKASGRRGFFPAANPGENSSSPT
jgi:hypothetical protein